MDIRTIQVGFNPLPIRQQSTNMSERQLGIHRPKLFKIRKTVYDLAKHTPANVCAMYNHLVTENIMKGAVTTKVTGMHKHDGKLPYDNAKGGKLPLYYVHAKLELLESNDVQYFSNLKYRGTCVENWINWPTVSHIMNGIHSNLKNKDDPFPKAIRAYFMHTINPMSATFSASTLLSGPTLVTEAIKLLHEEKERKGEREIPYIHVNESGPHMYYTFDKDNVHVFECKFNSRPTNFIEDKQCRVWIGPLIPKTLCNTRGCNFDLVFGILVQAEQKKEFVNVLTIIMTPASLAVVKVDWGPPYDQELVKFKKSVYTDAITSQESFTFHLAQLKSFELINDYRYLEGLDTRKKVWESRLQYGVKAWNNTTLTSIEDTIMNIINSVHITADVEKFILDNMPLEFTRQFIPVVGIDIDTDTRHAYQCCVGPFVRAAVKQNFLTQIYRNLAYAMLSQLMLSEYELTRSDANHTFPVTTMSNFDDLREVYPTIREFIVLKDDKDVYHSNRYDVNYDAHRMISSFLYDLMDVSPSGFGVNKFMKYSNERTLLYKLMELFFKLYYHLAHVKLQAPGSYHNEHIDTPLKSWTSEHFQVFRNIFSTIERAVDVSMGNEYVRSDMQKEREGVYDYNRTPMSASILSLVSMVGSMKHKMNSYTDTELHQFCMEEYIQPCTIREMNMPLVLPTICSNVDLSDILRYSRYLFDLYKSYYPYDPSTYPKNNDSQQMSMPFQPEDVCIRDRKFLMKANRMMGADDVTSANSLFVRLILDLDTKKLSLALMYPYPSASKTIVPVEAKGYHPGHAKHPSIQMKNTLDNVSTMHIKEMKPDENTNKNSYLSSDRVQSMMEYAANSFRDNLSQYGSSFRPYNPKDGTTNKCVYNTMVYDCTTEFSWSCRDLYEEKSSLLTAKSTIDYRIIVTAFPRAPIVCNGSEQLAWDLKFVAKVSRDIGLKEDLEAPSTRYFVLFPDEFDGTNTESKIKEFATNTMKEALNMLLECSELHHTLALTPYSHNTVPSLFITPAYHYMLEFIGKLSSKLVTMYTASATNEDPRLRHSVIDGPLGVRVTYHNVVNGHVVQDSYKLLVKINTNKAQIYRQRYQSEGVKKCTTGIDKFPEGQNNDQIHALMELNKDIIHSHALCSSSLEQYMDITVQNITNFIAYKDTKIPQARKHTQNKPTDEHTIHELTALLIKDIGDHFAHDCKTPYISVKATSYESDSNQLPIGARVSPIEDSVVPMMYSNNPPPHGTDTAMQSVDPHHIVIQKKDQLIQVKFVVLGGPHQHWMFLMNCFNTEGEMTGTNLRHKSIITSTINSSDMFTYRKNWFTAIQSAALALGWKTTKPMSKTEYTTMPLGALRLVVPTKKPDPSSKVTHLVNDVIIPDKTQTQITTIRPPNDADTAGIVNNTKAYVDPKSDAKQQLRRPAGIRLPKAASGDRGQETDMGGTEEAADENDATAGAAGAAEGMEGEADMTEDNTDNAGAGPAEGTAGTGDAAAGGVLGNTEPAAAGVAQGNDGSAAAATAPRARRRLINDGHQPSVTGRIGGASAEAKRNFSDAADSDTEAGDDDDEQRTFTPARPKTPPPEDKATGGGEQPQKSTGAGKAKTNKGKGKGEIKSGQHSNSNSSEVSQPQSPAASERGRTTERPDASTPGYVPQDSRERKSRSPFVDTVSREGGRRGSSRGRTSNTVSQDPVQAFSPVQTPTGGSVHASPSRSARKPPGVPPTTVAWPDDSDDAAAGGAVPGQGPPQGAYATLDLDDVLARLSLSI